MDKEKSEDHLGSRQMKLTIQTSDSVARQAPGDPELLPNPVVSDRSPSGQFTEVELLLLRSTDDSAVSDVMSAPQRSYSNFAPR